MASIEDGTAAQSIVTRYFTDGMNDPLESIEWVRRDARAGDFHQPNVEAPEFWSDRAVGITAKLYFATVDGVREDSVRQMIRRVAATITRQGIVHNYFPGILNDQDPGTPGTHNHEAMIFYDELCYLLVNQMAAFNTPVWLNVGVEGRAQCCSACFLLRVDDSMTKGDHSIAEWIKTEAKIFKMGAGSGVDLSRLRGSMELLSTGGTASGPTSYMRSGDANAGTLKSGGAHRRAACMRDLEVSHPDIGDFIDTKRREDRRMRRLLEAGEEINPFTPSGEKTIAETTAFQNANHSIKVTHAFMKAVENDDDWNLIARTTGEPVGEPMKARDILWDAADAAWTCGDPGVIYIDTVNEWHTTPRLRGKDSPITTCNPCGETWLNDDSSCNLASLNLLKFLREERRQPSFDHQGFVAAVDIMTMAMDITCSFSDLPTKSIERNTRDLRQLGLGYSNLGASLMVLGLPYDSDGAREWASSVTALMTGQAYWRSAQLARRYGAYACFEENKDSHLEVIERHRSALPPLQAVASFDDQSDSIWEAAIMTWYAASNLAREHGLRNAQVTVLAPTGTTSYLMDCDTTGIEPPYSLITHKGLAGGGSMTIENMAVHRALGRIGSSLGAILRKQGVEAFMASLPEKYRPIFASANEISPMGHLKMVAAVQPFLSGAPSKTINLDESATRDDIYELYVQGWRCGLKAISVYRDNSKVTQILSSKPKAKVEEVPESAETLSIIEREPEVEPVVPPDLHGGRRRLPSERKALTHKFSIDGHEGYITAGAYEDGRLGEFFLTGIGREGSFLQGMMGSWSIACSIAMQLDPDAFPTLARKYIGFQFEPRGMTSNPEIREATSIVDYVFRWLVLRFGDVDLQEELGVLSTAVKERMTARLDAVASGHAAPVSTNSNRSSRTRPCKCGGIMYASGSCYTCESCGSNTGCG